MDKGFLPCFLVGFLFALAVSVIPVSIISGAKGYREAMAEAFDRGHAVQCLGKEGYFWECEE